MWENNSASYPGPQYQIDPDMYRKHHQMVPLCFNIKIRAQADIFSDFAKDCIFLLSFVDIDSSNFWLVERTNIFLKNDSVFFIQNIVKHQWNGFYPNVIWLLL